ncbi:MAG: glycosyltransferase family 4 protein [Thermoplasmata archaeon]
MRVLLISHRFHPVQGGSEQWALLLARALQRRGETPLVLTQAEPGLPAEEDLGGIAIRRIPIVRAGRFRIPRGYPAILRRLDYDLLHLSGNRVWCADYLFPWARRIPGPKVITPHGFYQLAMAPGPLNRLYFTRYLPRVLSAFDGYLAMTAAEARQIVGFGYPGEKTHVVGTGIEWDEFERPPAARREWVRDGVRTPFVALSAGGTWENKRLDRVIASLAPLRDQVTLLIAGRDVPHSRLARPVLDRIARDHGVTVRFLGEIPREALLAAYREADVYLQGSSYEGFGLALLEAMASGLPFVAFPAGAAPELAAAGGGTVAESVPAFTAAVRAALARRSEDPEGERERTRAAAAPWRWDRLIDRYREAYRAAGAGRGGPNG